MTWFCSPPTSSVLLSVSRRLCMSSDSSMLWERGEDSPRTPAQLREAAGKGAEDLPSASPRSSFYTASRGAGTISP